MYTVTFREKIILKKKQELSERNNVFEADHSKVRNRHLGSLLYLSVVVAFKAETSDGGQTEGESNYPREEQCQV